MKEKWKAYVDNFRPEYFFVGMAIGFLMGLIT